MRHSHVKEGSLSTLPKPFCLDVEPGLISRVGRSAFELFIGDRYEVRFFLDVFTYSAQQFGQCVLDCVVSLMDKSTFLARESMIDIEAFSARAYRGKVVQFHIGSKFECISKFLFIQETKLGSSMGSIPTFN